jgi:hypothetical protein
MKMPLTCCEDHAVRPMCQQFNRTHRWPLVALGLLALAYAVLCWWGAADHDGGTGGSYQGPDDFMRMVQVLDWYRGADWYDLTQARLNPPQGVLMHWSRLPDLPLRLGIELLAPGMGEERAVDLTARLVPPLLGIGFFCAFVWAAAPLLGTRQWPLAGLICLALLIPRLSFVAGRVDHHGWQLMIALLGAGALLRVTRQTRDATLAMVGAGMAGAFGLWLGAEAIPPIALVTATLVLLWIIGFQTAAGHLVRFGAFLLLGVLLLYPIALPTERWLVPFCDTFSPVSLGLSAAVLVLGASLIVIEQSWDQNARWVRLVVASCLGLGLLMVLLWLFPECRHGPYGQLAEPVQQLIGQVKEARGIGQVLIKDPTTALMFLVLPVLGLWVTSVRLSRSSAEDPVVLYGALLVLIAAGIGLQFWQLRASMLANAYAGLGLTLWVVHWNERASAYPGRPRRLLLKGAPLLLIVSLPLLPHLLVSGFGHQPNEAGLDASCNSWPDFAALDQLPPGEARSLRIAAPVNLGPALLLKTRHAVFAAPYHRNAGGLEVNHAVFASTPDLAYRAVREYGVDMLVLCRSQASATEQDDASPTLEEQLQRGQSISWLKPVDTRDDRVLAFLVRPDSRAVPDLQSGG